MDIKQQPLSEELIQYIFQGFSRYAIARTGFDGKGEPVAFVAMDGDDCAGVVAVELFWGALHIKYMFVEEKFRGKRIGTHLMERAFAYGNEHRCPFAFVETMSFQAKGFYQKLGFHLEFTRSGYTDEIGFHYLRKNF